MDFLMELLANIEPKFDAFNLIRVSIDLQNQLEMRDYIFGAKKVKPLYTKNHLWTIITAADTTIIKSSYAISSSRFLFLLLLDDKILITYTHNSETFCYSTSQGDCDLILLTMKIMDK